MGRPCFARLAVLSVCLAAAAAAANLVRYPYVQNVGADRATITWVTDAPASTTLNLSGGARIRSLTTRRFPAAELGLNFDHFQHRAELEGLRPGTEYSYAVWIDDREEPAAPGTAQTFRTAAPGPFTFLAFGDSGRGLPEQFELADRMAAEKPALMLHTGDIVYPIGGFDLYQVFFFDPYYKLLARVPLFPSMGNHDFYTNSGAPYLAIHAVPTAGVPASGRGRYYSFDWGDAHFVALDSTLSLDEAAAGRGPMFDWLREDLAATRAFWKIVFMHHAPYSAGGYEHDRSGVLLRTLVSPILERYGVQLVLNGHEHNYQRTIPIGGVVYVTTGGGGAPLYDVSSGPQLAARAVAHHYVRAEVQDGRLRLEAVGLRGETLDLMTLRPQPVVSQVVEAAAFTAAAAPGGLITIFGRNLAWDSMKPTVRLGTLELPVLYASPNQVNAQLPLESSPGPARLRVETANGTTESDIQILDQAPAIFRTGAGPAVTHADGSLVSAEAPARAGEFLSIYATGLGKLTGNALRTPVLVRLAGRMMTPAYAGPAPGYPGLYQVNIRVPDAVSAGFQLLAIVSPQRSSNDVILPVQ